VSFGLHSPPHVVPEHTYEHATGAAHWPSDPQVCSSLLLEQRLVPGTQTPPQVLPTHAYVQLTGEPHWPFALHVC